ncbi:MAG: PilZ domain-containing protein [Candidatus Hydrogenedentes bacterium]|nr:PilZ domain-containing protein [Candidatus Hydrogenedentota bacterium]
MESVPGDQSALDDLRKGNRCLLNVMGQHFLVQITDVGAETMKVTFPGTDYPVSGMRVALEFHDELGYTYYLSHVKEGPRTKGEGIVLQKPLDLRRNRHRHSVRVPTDLMVQVKDQIHLRKYDAALLDLSGGGTLIATNAPFDFNTTVELSLSLPGEPTHQIIAQVVHAAEAPEARWGLNRLLGLRFVGLEPAVTRSIGHYIGRRLRELYLGD